MIYFETCYKGATNARGSKIGVKRSDDNRYKWFSYSYEDEPHRKAFCQFIKKYWSDFEKCTFIEAGGNWGNVYVFSGDRSKDYNTFKIK